MREFNDFEKAVITALVNARHSNDIVKLCAANYIMDATGCYAIEWITEVGSEKVEYYSKDKNAPISVIFGGLDVLSLLKYLDDSGYILVMQKTNASRLPKQLYNHTKYKYEYERYWRKMGENSWAVMDGYRRDFFADIALLLDRYANSIIYPTTELEQYVKRGFKTEDDVKFEAQQSIAERSLLITQKSVWVAIAIGLASLIATYVSVKAPITINEPQYNRIIESVRMNTTPKIVDVQIVNDTLDVNIKESVRLNTRSHITNMPNP